MLLILLWIFGFYLYITYQEIEIQDNSYTATKTKSTMQEQTVENVQEEGQKVADVLEEINEAVVGISKLKNTGNSILSNSTEAELGLGTGFLVTDDGYILSN